MEQKNARPIQSQERSEEIVESMSSEIAQKEAELKALSVRAAEAEQKVLSLTSELAAKDSELRNVSNTLAWRLMSRYGRIKYRYLLPIYRVLGLPPYSRRGRSQDLRAGAVPSPVEAESEDRHNVSSSSERASTLPPYAVTHTRERKQDTQFEGMASQPGICNICGHETRFFYSDEALYRESLVCGSCLTTSRYRSVARGILRAIREIAGVEAESIAELDPQIKHVSLKVYDTQVSFYYGTCAYPIPDLLAGFKWIDLQTSMYRPTQPMGARLAANTTNQNLEALTYPDGSFDIIVMSDVMEHVRLDDRAHREIRRVLKPGGAYLFTVPHFRESVQTLVRVAVIDPADPGKDEFPVEKEYHGDANSEDGRALSYRAYGTDLDETLRGLGFSVDYCKTDFPEMGIMNTELFYCRLAG